MSRPKVIFLPWVKVDPSNTERTPKLLHLISQWYEAVPVLPGRFNRMVYDQNVNRVLRYILFALDEVDVFLSALRAAKREDAELIFAEGTYFSLAGGMAARIRRIPLVWDNHANIKDFSAALGKSKLFYRGNLFLERLLYWLSAAVLVVSEREKRAYGEMGFGKDRFTVVPTCADLALLDASLLPREEAKEKLGIPDGPAVLFIGTLRYYPNQESAQYIAREMIPAVRTEVPNATAYLAGSGELGMQAPDGVRPLGFVPDLAAWMSAADVCIAPTWRGVGILTKVIDMLSAGRATVVSPLALEGIPELVDGENCLVGDGPAHFAQQVVLLLNDAELRRQLEENGRKLVEEGYSWEVVGPRLHRLLDDLIGRPADYSSPSTQQENNVGVSDG